MDLERSAKAILFRLARIELRVKQTELGRCELRYRHREKGDCKRCLRTPKAFKKWKKEETVAGSFVPLFFIAQCFIKESTHLSGTGWGRS